MTKRDITPEEFEQMLIDLENGTFIPTANEGAMQPLYFPYKGWHELLDCDQLACEAISEQYVELIDKK